MIQGARVIPGVGHPLAPQKPKRPLRWSDGAYDVLARDNQGRILPHTRLPSGLLMAKMTCPCDPVRHTHSLWLACPVCGYQVPGERFSHLPAHAGNIAGHASQRQCRGSGAPGLLELQTNVYLG